MLIFFLLAALVGGAFGLIFRIWILLPASLLVIAGFCIFDDGAMMSVLQRCVVAVLSLQGGYGMGLTARYVMVAGRARALRPAPEKPVRERLSRPI